MKHCRQLLLSAKIGDGSYFSRGKINTDKPRRYGLCLVAKQSDYLLHKREILVASGITVSCPTKVFSGYKKGAFSYSIRTRTHQLLSEVGNLSTAECVEGFKKEALYYYYLDDGTYHQKKHFMHLYCNTFSLDDVAVLINKIYELYPINKAKLRWDKKKDGRQYPYLYIPVSTAEFIRQDVEDFLLQNNIVSLLYKVGLPSTTIENRRG